jgi:choline-sulfatase
MAFDQDVFARAAQWLRERERVQSDRPFCLLAGGVLPHNPYVCPRELFEEYMDRLPPPNAGEDLSRLHPAMLQWRRVRGIDQLTPQQIRRARAAYYGLVTYLDGLIGGLLAALADTGLAQNTVVAYLSDHGDMAGEHGIWWKDSFYEGSVGVPMLWSRPDDFAQGTTCTTPVSLLDVAPTCLELGGAEPLPLCRGQSLMPLLRGGKPESDDDRAVFSEIYPSGMFPARMIRRGRWKLNHFHGYEHPQLFDLQNDPGEKNDLGQDPGHASVRDALRQQVLQGWSGQAVERIAQLRKEEYTLLGDYNSRFPPGRSELWREPSGSNIIGASSSNP